ncbi:MAG TPA: hypothetical protein ENN07_02920 [candidate division Zixibacteria bacterium]|nr:hypothetical protein [candidate division Zixibacteria bacterium]
MACAGPRAVSEFRKVDIDRTALLDTLAHRDNLLETAAGRISVRVESDIFESSFSADFFFSAPDSFRANIRGMIGSVPASAVTIGDSTALFIPSKDSLYIAIDGEEENPVIGLRIGMADLVNALIGRLELAYDSLVSFDYEGQTAGLLLTDGFVFRRIEILPSAWVPKSVQIFSEDGSAIIDIGYFDFVEIDGIIRPTKVMITNPLRNEKVMIEVEREILGGTLPEGIFHLPVPDDVGIWYLSRRNDDNRR